MNRIKNPYGKEEYNAIFPVFGSPHIYLVKDTSSLFFIDTNVLEAQIIQQKKFSCYSYKNSFIVY